MLPSQGPILLQTVQEERPAPESPAPLSSSSFDKPKLQENPSRRPLGRKAHDHFEKYARTSEVAKRSVYAQEGDVEPNEFQQTVAELLKEEEYGIFRLVAPHVSLSRTEFESYVKWLNSQGLGSDGMPLKQARSIFGLPLLAPFNRFSLCWMTLMTVIDLMWTAFGVPINVAFCSINYGRWGTNCTGTDLAFGIIYFLNLVLSFNMGLIVVNGHRKKAVTDGRRVALYYVRYGRFILDAVATIPFVYLLIVLGISNGAGSKAKWVNAVSLIRLVRLLRLVSMSKVIYIDSLLGADSWLAPYLSLTTLYIFMVGYQIAVLINFFACILVLLAYLHGLDESWMTAVSWIDLPDEPKPYQWYCAVYWVTTTTTTTGFGDFSPRWWGEQVVIGLAMIAGMIVFGILVGWITNALARASSAADRLQDHIKKISQVNQWLSNCKNKLTSALRLRIQEYFAQVYVSKQVVDYGEAELFDDLPPYLRFEVAGEMALPLVQRVHALRDLNLDAQQFLAAHLRPVRAIVGQELCRQGDEADRLWLLESGRLVALRHKEKPEEVSAPALVGESLILAIDIPQCRHRPWTLRAAVPCGLWELQLSDLSRVVQIYPALRLTLLEALRMDLVKCLFLLGAHPDENLEAQLFPSLTTDWCELLALLRRAMGSLHDEDPVALDEMCIELERANIEDGSLQARMAELIEGAMVRDGLAPEAVLGLPLDVQQQVHQAQQAEQEAHGNSGQLAVKGFHAYPFNRLPSGALRDMPRTRSRVHDSHHGPAPWGVTTEDVLAATGRHRASYSITEEAAQAPYGPSGGGGNGSSGCGSDRPPSPVRPPAAATAWSGSGLLPLPPLPERRGVGRVDVLQREHMATSDAGSRQGDRPSLKQQGQVQTAGTPGALDMAPDDGEGGGGGGAAAAAAAAGRGGGGGAAATDYQPPAVESPASPPLMPPRPMLMPPPELEDDPIAAETGWVSPKVRQLGKQQSQTQQQLEQPTMRTSGSGDPAASGSGPRYPPVSTGPPGPSRRAGGGIHRLQSDLRRSHLSRLSSPFAGMGAAGPVHGLAAGPAPTAAPAEVGHPVDPAAAAAAAGTLPPPCAMCGASACPSCGSWAATSHFHPVAQRYGTLGVGPGSSGSGPGGVAAGPGISTSESGQLVRPVAAISLAGAVRGGVGSISIRQRSGSPMQAPAGQQPPQLQVPQSPAWAATGGPPPGSPAGGLSRMSRMFGRSFAATVRTDSLVRHTLMRETYGPTYETEAPEEEELAAESAPVRGGSPVG